MKTNTLGANSTHPPIAAIILNWNGEELLKRFLPEVIANSDPALTRIFVVDNGSTDGSVEVLNNLLNNLFNNVSNKLFNDLSDDHPQNAPAPFEIIRFHSNLGFAAGYNRAVAEVGDYKYCALINSDLAPDKGWDATLYEYMESHPDVGAAQPKILSYSDSTRFEYAGAAGGFLDKNGYPYCRGRIFGTCEVDHGQYDAPTTVFWASGAAFMVRRHLYLSLGGLDPAFFAHMEEIDLCWRIQLAGYQVAAVPTASVRHLGGGSLPIGNPRKTYLNFRNNLLMMYKNLPARDRCKALMRRRLLDTLAWLKAFATLNFGDVRAILRAHRDFRRMRLKCTSEPAENKLDSAPGAQRNILVDYFLRGRRKFSDLT